MFLFDKLTGSFEWAYDKVAGLQRECLYDIITRNNSEINDTQSVIDQVNDEAEEIISFICTPFDCNGHGECVNGICECGSGLLLGTIIKLSIVCAIFRTKNIELLRYVFVHNGESTSWLEKKTIVMAHTFIEKFNQGNSIINLVNLIQ